MKLFSFSESIKSANAHSKNEQYESFTRHVERTEYYLDKLFKTHDLNEILLKMLRDMGMSVNSEKLLDCIKQIIAYHDIGKLTDQFQRKLKGAKIRVSHSDVGFFTILVKLWCMYIEKQLSDEEFKTLFALSTVVHRHHSHLCDINEFCELTSEYNRKKRAVRQIIEKYIDKEKENLLQKLEQIPQLNVKEIIRFNRERRIVLFFLYKIINSLLLSADYFATMEFETGCGFCPRVITRDTVEKLNRNVSSHEVKGNFNCYIDTNFDQLLTKCGKLNEISSLNELRSIIAVSSEQSLLEKTSGNSGNVFFLEVPTGGGKTNLALRLVRRLLQKGNYRKVIYVLPYINIIEQNYDYFRRFISEDIITRLDHTYIRAYEKEENAEEFKVYTEQLFMNYPFLFMSHVKFFDMIFESAKSSNYNFYQLANSIIVIDEIQAYKTKYWDLLTQMFHYLACYLNTTFIVMSATLPKFKELLLSTQDKQRFIELLNDNFVKKLYAHRLFDRVELKPLGLVFSETNIEEFAHKILEKSKDKQKVLIVLNSIKESLKLYETFERIAKDFEIYLLNSTILPSRRREILRTVNSNQCGKVILISTQSIEAGVDIDFDIGFRAIAPLDSIVQAMGRVNRHGIKPKACLYIFEDTKWKYVYKNDIRAQVSKESLPKLKKGIIDMNAYYDEVLQKMKSILNSSIVQTDFDLVKELKFGSIASNVKLIDAQTMSLFIPCEIGVQGDVLKWLKERGIACEDRVHGSDVWQYYLNLLESKESFEDLYRIKEFSKILSLFTVNVFNYSTEKGRTKELLKDELRDSKVYYANDYQEYYSYEKGLNVEKFIEKKLGREFEII